MKIKISAGPVDREKNSPELSAAEFFNLFELRPPLKNLYDNYNTWRGWIVHEPYLRTIDSDKWHASVTVGLVNAISFDWLGRRQDGL